MWEGKGFLDTSDIDCVLTRITGTIEARGLNPLHDLAVVQFEVFHGDIGSGRNLGALSVVFISCPKSSK